MTTDDRDLLLALRRQQSELQQMLERLNTQLAAIEIRLGVPVQAPVLPPIPRELVLPPIPRALPPIPSGARPALPVAAAPVEFDLGKWLTRLGLGLFAITLFLAVACLDYVFHLHQHLGPAARFGLFGLTSSVAMNVGRYIERRTRDAKFLGRTLFALGVGGIYLALYAAWARPSFQLWTNPLFAGVLLLGWSFYVLYRAERRQSRALGIFGILLAYLTTALNPVAEFSMGANLVLAATAASFLMRNGWATLPTLGLIGSYLAVLRQLVLDPEGYLVLDTSRTLAFWPFATYLIGTWVIFTTATICANAPTFRGGKRLSFLSLNNASLAFLLGLTAFIAGYGPAAVGWTLLDIGLVFLVISRFAGFAEVDPVDLMGAYAAQGLALFTAGIIVICTGMTRALTLLVETLLLGIAGAFAGDRILTVSTYVAGFFAAMFSIWQIAYYAHHPWLLGFGGALIMLINAWSTRSEVRNSRVERSTIVFSTTCYCLLAIGLIFASLSTVMSDAALPAALATAALVLTFAIYHFSIFELPALAQILLLAALALALYPAETGEDMPAWTLVWVGAITLTLIAWWARQRTMLTRFWTQPLVYLYALALALIVVRLARPYCGAQEWMVVSSLFALAFLSFGAFTRVWAVAVFGQLLLALSLYHFFFPPHHDPYPWTWLAAAVPVLVTFETGRFLHRWLLLSPEIQEPRRTAFDSLAYLCKLIALAGVVRWVYGIVPATDRMDAFLFLGTFLLSTSVKRADAFGVRSSFVLSVFGMIACLASPVITFLNGFAVLLFLAQPPLLRREGRQLITSLEKIALLLFATLTGWVYVTAWAAHPQVATAWALYAFFLFLFGLLARDGGLRWCGLVILVAAMGRMLCLDLWGLSGGFRVLTVLLLFLIAIGIGIGLIFRNSFQSTKNL